MPLLLNPAVGAGLFNMLSNANQNLRAQWPTVASLGGVLVVIVAIFFTVMFVIKQRDKARWGWAALLAWIVGGILLTSGIADTISGDTQTTWNDIFGSSLVVKVPTNLQG